MARAKMHLKMHLAWLDGFPVAQDSGRIDWMVRPCVGAVPVQMIEVDRERLRQSQSALIKLTNRFPHAMPRIVGDVPAWSTRVQRLLDQLKEGIHLDKNVLGVSAAPYESLPRLQRQHVDRLHREHPILSEIVRAVIWAGAVWHQPRDFLLGWILEQATRLKQHLSVLDPIAARTNILLLGDLVRHDGPDKMDYATKILCDARSFTVATTEFSEEVQRFLAELRGWTDYYTAPPVRPSQPAANFGPQFIHFVYWLAGQKRPIRRQASDLAGQVFSHRLLDDWQAAWDDLQAEAQSTIRRLSDTLRSKNRDDFRLAAAEAAKRLEELSRRALPILPIRKLGQDIQTLTREKPGRLIPALCRFLRSVPFADDSASGTRNGQALRLATLHEVAENVDLARHSRIWFSYLEQSRAFLQAMRDQPYWWRPWEGLISSWNRKRHCWDSPYEMVQDEFTEPSQMLMFFDALARLVTHPQYHYELHSQIARLTTVSTDVDTLCQRFAELATKGLLKEVSKAQLRAAAALESESCSFSELCELFNSLDSPDRAIAPFWDVCDNCGLVT